MRCERLAKIIVGWCVIITSIHVNNIARLVERLPLSETIFCVLCLRFIEATLKRVFHGVGSQGEFVHGDGFMLLTW